MTSSPKPCLGGCGALTSLEGGRCAECAAAAQAVREQARDRSVYDDPRWRRIRKRVIARHRKRHGWLCPGWRREPHLAARLSADHIVPVSRGGAPFDERNVQVLCVDCNRAKGDQLEEVA